MSIGDSTSVSIKLLISLMIKFQPMNLSSVVSYVLLSSALDKISLHNKKSDLGLPVLRKHKESSTSCPDLLLSLHHVYFPT